MNTHDIIPFRIIPAPFHIFAHENNDTPAQNKFPEHRHAQYELFFLFHGDVEMAMGDRREPLREMDLLIIPAGVSHRIHFKKVSPYRRLIINVSAEHLRTLGIEGFFALLDQYAGKPINLAETPFLQLLPQFSRVAAIEIAPEAQMALFNEGILSLYLSMLLVVGRQSESPADQLIDSAVQFINGNLHERLTIESIAEQLYTSGSYLCKTFRRKMGLPLMHYVNRQRIFRAKELMLEGVPLKEVYLRCGYENYITFFRVFRQETGKSPSAFTRGE